MGGRSVGEIGLSQGQTFAEPATTPPHCTGLLLVEAQQSPPPHMIPPSPLPPSLHLVQAQKLAGQSQRLVILNLMSVGQVKGGRGGGYGRQHGFSYVVPT